ncbi:hypothetical protein [Bathymodiolus platifrons methanotrophic gill symbiont]|uniref:hypothetical protein n=1 Tax=Bathymodiolus platifrons methanotrophic gill symbiont TaxID=113268 RepID=UPI003B84B157
MAISNGSTAIRDKILASLARYRALRIGKFPCAFWRLSSRPGLTAVDKPIETTGSRTRLNIIGAIRLGYLSEAVTDQYKTINRCQPWRANARAGSPQKA